MKRRSGTLGLVLVLLLIWPMMAGRCENVSGRKLTLMVYLCGSNLESSAGAATDDLQEMLDTQFDRDLVSVLVMAGGSKDTAGSAYFEPDRTMIHEIAPGRSRRIQEFETALNMGNAETLAGFLRFGIEARPAERYALILWDHGGGPLEGVCWDEHYPSDRLSLAELKTALADAGLEQKLSWIGFDACLMASLEVANALAPYAEYMVASQETEPASGWNYAFLNSLEKDENGEETGRRIVDHFFAVQGTGGEILTLSVIDLSKVASAVNAVSSFFSPFGVHLSADQFISFSGFRMGVTGFGKAVRGLGDDGYDLVDARDLILQMDAEGDQRARVLDRLDQAVVYSRSNEEGANGLTLYHPYINKNDYLGKWKARYEQMRFCPGYTQYLKSFASILTGEGLTSWAHLETQHAGLNEQGEQVFTLQLSEEQAKAFSSAQLLILMNAGADGRTDSYVLVSSTKAEMDPNGLLTAAYGGRTLYAVNDQQKTIGPISYLQTEDGAEDIVWANFRPADSAGLSDYQAVLYYLKDSPDDGAAEILRKKIQDPETGRFTTRLAFSELDYSGMALMNIDRIMPDDGNQRVLPRFTDWESNQSTLSGYSMNAQTHWQFCFRKTNLTGRSLYALFQITDAQQNAYCSPPVPIPNSSLFPWAASRIIDRGEYQMKLSGQVDTSELSPSLRIALTVTNCSDHALAFTCTDWVANDHRLLSETLSPEVGPHETITQWMEISPDELTFLDHLDALSFSIQLKRDGDPSGEDEPTVRFGITDCDLSAIASHLEPIACSEQDALTAKLLSVSMDDIGSEFTIRCHLENHRTEEVHIDALLLNGIQTSTETASLPAGKDLVFSFTIPNRMVLQNYDLSLPGKQGWAFYSTALVRQIQQIHGFHQLSEIRFALHTDLEHWRRRETLNLVLEEPWPFPEITQETLTGVFTLGPQLLPPTDEKTSLDELQILWQNSQYTIRFRRALLGDGAWGDPTTKTCAVCLEIENKSDQFLWIRADNVSVNGTPCDQIRCAPYPILSDFVTAPHSILTGILVMNPNEPQEPGSPVDRISFSLYARVQDATEPVTLFCDPSAAWDTEGGCWLEPENISAQTVFTPDLPTIYADQAPQFLDPELVLPGQAQTCQTWLPAPLTDEQLTQYASGYLSLVRFMKDGTLQLLLFQELSLDSQGRPGALFPGLTGCIEDHPELFCLTVVFASSKEALDGRLFTTLRMPESNQFLSRSSSLRKMDFTLDYLRNQATIDHYDQTGSFLPTYQSQIREASVGAYTAEPAYAEDGTLLHFDDLPWGENAMSDTFPLNGKPLRIRLRPLLAEDQAYLLYSIENQDGTRYSLPLIPYTSPMEAPFSP